MNLSPPANVDHRAKQLGDGCTEIGVSDWAGNDGNRDLVQSIFSMNARREMLRQSI